MLGYTAAIGMTVAVVITSRTAKHCADHLRVAQQLQSYVPCKRPVRFRPTADPTVEACGHYVRLVGPTGQSDDQSRCSVGGTCCLYIAAAVIYTSGG